MSMARASMPEASLKLLKILAIRPHMWRLPAHSPLPQQWLYTAKTVVEWDPDSSCFHVLTFKFESWEKWKCKWQSNGIPWQSHRPTTPEVGIQRRVPDTSTFKALCWAIAATVLPGMIESILDLCESLSHTVVLYTVKVLQGYIWLY